MCPAGFEPAISAIEQPQTYALDSTATGSVLTTIPISGNNVQWNEVGIYS